MRVPGQGPRTAGQDGIPGSRPGPPDPGAAQGPYPPEWQFGTRAVPVRRRYRGRCSGAVAQGADPPSRAHTLPARGSTSCSCRGRCGYEGQTSARWPGRCRNWPATRSASSSSRRPNGSTWTWWTECSSPPGTRPRPVDIVVLPESAAEQGEINDLEALLGRHGVTGLITGVRERPEQPGQFPRNWVHIGVCCRRAVGAHQPGQAPPLVAR